MESEPRQPVCYVTTTGRVTGRDHTIEIWYVEHDGCIYLLSGNEDRADWVRNMKVTPLVTVSLAPEGAGGRRSPPARYLATVGPVPDERCVREAIERRYRDWQPGQPLSAWAAESLVVRLSPADGGSSSGSSSGSADAARGTNACRAQPPDER
jgi:hypothetical protein